jgi:cytochrome c oxidase subunit 1
LNASYGLRSWLLTTDHKRIAWLYLISVTFFFFIGGSVRNPICEFELLTPQGDLVQAETYNKLFTMHGRNDDFLFFDSIDPGRIGKLFDSVDDRRS